MGLSDSTRFWQDTGRERRITMCQFTGSGRVRRESSGGDHMRTASSLGLRGVG